MRPDKSILPGDFPSLLFVGQLAYLTMFAFVRVMLQSQGIEPPLIDGLNVLSYSVIGGISIGYFAARTMSFRSYGLLVSLFILYLSISPIFISAFFKPEHIDLVPQYLGYAFSAAFYTSMGYLFRRQTLDYRLVLLLWWMAFMASVPAILEMISLGVGGETFVSRSGFHIPLGDLFLFISLIAMALSPRMTIRVGIYALSILALLAIGSRTSLYVFVPTLMVIFVLEARRSALWPSLLVALLVAWFVSPAAMTLLVHSPLGQTRMFQFLVSPVLNTSWRARNIALQGGLEDIAQHPLLGSFGSHVERFGDSGMYIHNYLEIWRQFGLLPFGAFLVLLVIALIAPIITRSSYARMAAVPLFAVPLLSQITFSRSYGYSYIFFIFGIAAALLMESARERNQAQGRTGRWDGAATRRRPGVVLGAVATSGRLEASRPQSVEPRP